MAAPLADYKLFTPLKLGEGFELKNRVVMSPLTRARAEHGTFNVGDHHVAYYEQRASAGLIITEATCISAEGCGWYGAPGIWTEEHVAGWKKVTDAVHAKGGKIVMQLWHMGRRAHSSFNGGKQTVSSSALLVHSRMRDADGKLTEQELPRALETDEIPQVVEVYRKAAENAKKAGFDGVEIHSANGYLIDQFLQSSSNIRTDKYGGSYENRARFFLEIIDAVKTVWPADRIGVRLSANGSTNGMGSADNYEQFTYTMDKLSTLGLAYLAILDGESWGVHDKGRLVTAFDAKLHYKGTVIVNVGYTRDTAEGALRSGSSDAVCFGRAFIANPDLVERFKNDWPLEPEAAHEYWWDADKKLEGYATFPPYKAE